VNAWAREKEDIAMSEKIVSQRVYYTIFACLIALTLLTVWLSFQELGAWHGVVGLAIAACKASLVALFFMHVLYGGRLVWMLVGTGLFWLGILMTFTLADYLTRSWLAY
jgi:cytochrome c oxidase subunit IV